MKDNKNINQEMDEIKKIFEKINESINSLKILIERIKTND